MSSPVDTQHRRRPRSWPEPEDPEWHEVKALKTELKPRLFDGLERALESGAHARPLACRGRDGATFE